VIHGDQTTTTTNVNSGNTDSSNHSKTQHLSYCIAADVPKCVSLSQPYPGWSGADDKNAHGRIDASALKESTEIVMREMPPNAIQHYKLSSNANFQDIKNLLSEELGAGDLVDYLTNAACDAGEGTPPVVPVPIYYNPFNYSHWGAVG